jgi:hypothetical protein
MPPAFRVLPVGTLKHEPYLAYSPKHEPVETNDENVLKKKNRHYEPIDHTAKAKLTQNNTNTHPTKEPIQQFNISTIQQFNNSTTQQLNNSTIRQFSLKHN